MLSFSIDSPKLINGPIDSVMLLHLVNFSHIILPCSCGNLPCSCGGISYIILKEKKEAAKQARKLMPILLSHPLKLLYLPLSSLVSPKDQQLATIISDTMCVGAFSSPNADTAFIHSNKVNVVAEILQHSTHICRLNVFLCSSSAEVTESSSFISGASGGHRRVHFSARITPLNLT